ncbi:hypothetical protein CL629_02825 [bacterium]|nr:hypothetical protein [bacterium]
MRDLNKMVNDLKQTVNDKKLSRTDRLLLDILSEMADILTSGFREKPSLKKKRVTSDTRTSEIKNDSEKVLSLQDFLRSRGRPDRRK